MKIPRTCNPIPPIAYLWIAIAIFASSSSVTRKIIELGQTHLVHGRNPISLCNILFVGNICAFLVMGSVFHRDWRLDRIRQLRRVHWLSLTFVAILSGALAPAMIVTALDKTTVTNVVLIGRLEPPLTLALGIWLLRARVNFWTIVGSIVSFIGVAVTVFLAQPDRFVNMMGIHFGTGELLVAGGALCLSIATTINQMHLRGIPFGIVSGYRTFLGTIIFFCLAISLYGSEHFAEAFSPGMDAGLRVDYRSSGSIMLVSGTKGRDSRGNYPG
jgi:drug/metabolite transporter (DMT)-like permease